MKKLKYLLFLFIIFLTPRVFADTSYNMTSLITSPVNFSECGNGSYTGVELNGATNCWNTNTRYQGTLNRIYFNLPSPTGSSFEPDTTYRLTLNMATQDWRNNFGSVVVSPGSSYTNNFVDTFSFVSMKQVNITFTVPYSASTTYQALWVNLPAKNSSSLITGTSNWNLSNVTLTKLTSGSSGGSTTPSGPTTTFDDTAIINNSNENTQNVINNNNQNTQDIINNNNQNTQDIINNNNQNFSTVTDILGDCYYNLLDPNDVNASSSNGINYSPVRDASDDTLLFIQINGTATSNSFYRVFNGTFTTHFDYYIYQNNFPDGVQLYCADGNDNRFYTNIPSNTTINTCYIRVSSGTVLNGLRVYPQISLYQNVPYTPYGVQKCFSKLDNISDSINSVGSNVINDINNATQSAVNNANNIISNNNQNTDKQIDSQKVCFTIDNSKIKTTGYLNNNGSVNPGNPYGVTDYIKLNSNDTILVLRSTGDTFYYCFYNSNKSIISCTRSNNNSVNSSISIPSNTSYVRFSINKGQNAPQYTVCRDGNQSLNDTLTDTNDYLKDDSDPNIDNNEITSLFSNVGYSDPLNYLLQLPTMLINKLVSLSDTCQSINLGTLLGSPIIFPCINLENIVGSSVWNTIDVICTVGLLVVIFKNLYQTFANLMTMGGEKEAREKFNMPTPMEFLSYILGGDR